MGRAQQRLARAPARCEAGGRTGGLRPAGVLCRALRTLGGGGGGVPLPVRNPTTPFPRVLNLSAFGRGAKSLPKTPHAHVKGTCLLLAGGSQQGEGITEQRQGSAPRNSAMGWCGRSALTATPWRSAPWVVRAAARSRPQGEGPGRAVCGTRIWSRLTPAARLTVACRDEPCAEWRRSSPCLPPSLLLPLGQLLAVLPLCRRTARPERWRPL